ncbi:sensor histidine kinase [Spirosoma arcticum]
MLSGIADYFIPPYYNDHPEDRRSARLLVLVLIYAALAELISVSNGAYLQYAEAEYILLASGLLNFVLLILFKRGLSVVACTNINLSYHAVGFFLQSWWGGGLESPATTSLFLLPTVAMLLAGKRSATVWLLIALGILTFFFVYEEFVGQLPVHYDLQKKSMYLFGANIGIIVVLYIITVAFNQEKNRAIDSLIEKNEQLLATQNQLIQKEKMASLGELTAGIAHEIQNPLNFVNNFSEISQEMIEEIQDERKKAAEERDESLHDELLGDLARNIKKITHHGGRASAIIHSMLEHSRTSAGERQPTNLNALCDEYLRLSYHGLRAKDKSFNATLLTDFDATLPEMTIVPQDMGRVLLNLFNNAFYAVQQHQKESGSTDNGKAYRPTVWVSTKALTKGLGAVISVRDNGTGVPDAVKDKIFQPFFTTKPTGEGTGLGLSLSYDIVTKGHGGEMRMQSVEGEGTEFIIRLPVVAAQTK